jgi:hypothetical protein
MIIDFLMQLEPGEMPANEIPPDFDLNDSTQCFFYIMLSTPFKFFNFILVSIFQSIINFLPSTPESYKIGNLLNQVASSNPMIWAISGEIVSFFGPILLIVAFAKSWKIFKPF